MQHQKQNVLVLAKRKQMRPQRHLARKIKPNLRRSRQRTRKLTFPYRAYRKPKAPRSTSQNLLPRNPKPLRKDRAQALVALNNIPKRSFQRPNIQSPSKPYRQRDHVAPARTLQPLQKPQPALPIRQRHLGRTLNRSQRWTRRQQRMATKRKKVVVNPNTLQTQYLGKQRAQQLLTRIARQTQNTSTNLRRRQRPAVKLPVRSQRQTIQKHDRGRHHVVG